MMNEHASSPTSLPKARPSWTGRVLLAVVFVTATALAFGLVWATHDDTLSRPQRQAREQIRRLEGLFKSYHRLMGRFPTQEEGFAPLVASQVLDAVPVDPWGHPYVYRMEARTGAVLSLGSDGQPGGTGDAADVFSGGLVAQGVQP